MKNPVKQWFSVRSSWRSLNQKHPGIFDWCDASMQLRRVLLPARFHDKAAGAKLAAHTKIEKVEGDLFRVDCLCEESHFFGMRHLTITYGFLSSRSSMPEIRTVTRRRQFS